MGCDAPKPDDSATEAALAAASKVALATCQLEAPGEGAAKGGYGAIRSDRSWSSVPYQPAGAAGGKSAGARLPPADSAEPLLPQWLCLACGFMNKAGNQVCGGTSDMGCKALYPGTQPDALQQVAAIAQAAQVAAASELAQAAQAAQMAQVQLEMAQLVQAQQYQMMGYGATGGSTYSSSGDQDNRWHCTKCGFWNKPVNAVCGGTGPIGCKAPRPDQLDPFQQAQALFLHQQAAATTRILGGTLVGGSAASASTDAAKWACDACGFVNRPSNSICGGGGPLGCKRPRPDHALAGDSVTRHRLDLPDSWVCDSCGFVNSARNAICGGNGPMGCKKARADQVASDLKQYREAMNKRATAAALDILAEQPGLLE